jgi:hypothetical protein
MKAKVIARLRAAASWIASGIGGSRSRIALVLASALFWLLFLAAVGISATSVGVGMQYGAGHGLVALGLLCLGASELVRRGMMSAV